uniref:Starch synthase catalytic domain-containing protein n=1 Tax=Lactuca sativa TaxID=4236 RepID=A0A9R1UN47_LACSA|nr:hypothetical protein LSAT_V11C800449030 [Lactuca sativa]
MSNIVVIGLAGAGGGKAADPNGVILLEPMNQFFKGEDVYGGSYNELEAYLFFSRACLEWMQVTGTQRDVIHVHEWQDRIQESHVFKVAAWWEIFMWHLGKFSTPWMSNMTLLHAHYQIGNTPLALVWKDETCSEYVIDTDNKGQIPNQQQTALNIGNLVRFAVSEGGLTFMNGKVEKADLQYIGKVHRL